MSKADKEARKRQKRMKRAGIDPIISERSCSQCGAIWYAHRDRNVVTNPQVARYRMSATGSRMTLGGGRRAASLELRANALQQQADRETDLRRQHGARCPGCGLSAFTEREVPYDSVLQHPERPRL